ncbi:pyrimidine reductase family protein [Nocardioides sp. zg-579]|uniref:Pyrimidine reductase family protein n=1 Tax=Nocardioides marmotae TaxID=2663857 RepID=A0A6I3JCI5_9ACTN|nr:dihydrofolate reductase family protein [Nocardioides marmotae]MCR6032207.1 pyrimidine reductase family protein [Gordonia jinghuaiqii]MTB95854.1 pyrimidine reductase family protein [Nocardioides marmotae]QKE02796.1 pyrimidine reductase family protein [Nocardioides marmotae]
MRVLLGPRNGDLADLYAVPRRPWLRANMVGTVDGAATGPDGRSGSINNAADQRVFAVLRAQADAVVVGAGTARAEEYGPADAPLVLVSRRAEVPSGLRGHEPGRVLVATCATAEHLEEARALLGDEHVLVLGEESVDLVALRETLVGRGWESLLSEGGPHLLADLLAAGLVDELCTTVVPRVIAGDGPRITAGPPVDVPMSLELLLEERGTLLARWFVEP